MERRREEARAHPQELAAEICEADESVKRIWSFGSAFDSRLPFRERSDIDLAVEEGSTLAWKISQRSRWKVDWIELSDQRESMVKAIVELGGAIV
jgi:predicted nucleotidyltransferase